ncbi:hypothetical protein Salat_2543800 [Sesamum alatum]|uniref:Uncharacterized protein n=1 Tax=Sesamum alatum TaxID=300844 RepID=A0AAE2CCM1_9LAMI|nr:hypothetical protein Salat_2543800 [Sesamum alatum]
MSSSKASSQQNNHVGASKDGVIVLPFKFLLKLGAKKETQVVEKDLLDHNMIHSLSKSPSAEIATVMMSLIEKSYRIPWLIWIQLVVMILLILLLFFGFTVFTSDSSNSSSVAAGTSPQTAPPTHLNNPTSSNRIIKEKTIKDALQFLREAVS